MNFLVFAVLASLLLSGCGTPVAQEDEGGVWEGLPFSPGESWLFTHTWFDNGLTIGGYDRNITYHVDHPALIPYFSGDLMAFQLNRTDGERERGIDFHAESGLPLGMRMKREGGEFWNGGAGGYRSHEFRDPIVLAEYIAVAFSGMTIAKPLPFVWANTQYIAKPMDGALRIEPQGNYNEEVPLARVGYYDIIVDHDAYRVDLEFLDKPLSSLRRLEASSQPPFAFDVTKTPSGHGLPAWASEDWQHRFLDEPFTGSWPFPQAAALDLAEDAQGWPSYGRYIVRSAHWYKEPEGRVPVGGTVVVLERNEIWTFKVQEAGTLRGVEFNVTRTTRHDGLMPIHEVSSFRPVTFQDTCEGQMPQPRWGAVPLALQMEKAGFNIRFLNSDLVQRASFVDPNTGRAYTDQPITYNGRQLPLPCDWRLQALGENADLYNQFPLPPRIPVLDVVGWQTGDGYFAIV